MVITFPSILGSLVCLRSWGFRPKLAVDVGAYHGDWTRLFKQVFPESAVVMVEAQEQKRPILESVCQSFPGDVSYQMALLARQEGTPVRFVEMETGSSVFEEASPYPRHVVEKTARTLDGLLAEAAARVDFLKLDVQGYELEVLAGAPQSLKSAKAVLMEASLLGANAGCPLIFDVMKFMDAAGFRLADFCSQIRRRDGALWQTDLLFVRADAGLLPDPKLTAGNWG
ncbi:MAG: FkbM family methyltransferase [Planctomycetes bacterium]|nr:FkbM family methyltransferase [Planctomycetota bacterium]